MKMSTESRIFFKLVELFGQHKAYDYNLSCYWNDERKLVIYIEGKLGEAVLDFECNTNFDIDMFPYEGAVEYTTLTVAEDSTDGELKDAVATVVAFLLDPDV